jgi:ADP-ribose pyrophosphatase
MPTKRLSPRRKPETTSSQSGSTGPKAGSARAWQVLTTRTIYSAPPWVTLSLQQVRLPDGHVVLDYHQLQLPEYTVIFAETTDGRVIVERQYKHGVGAVTLMLPAGLVESGEAPLTAAQRELLEETGYTAEGWVSLGSFVPNANYGCGKAHFFRAHHARRVAKPASGDLEEMEILLMPVSELIDALARGQIHVTSVAAAIAMASNPRLNGAPRATPPLG